MPLIPAPKRDEPRRPRQYAPKSEGRSLKYKVVANWAHHPEWADSDQAVSESRWHTLKLTGDCTRADLEGMTIDRDVTITVKGKDGRTETIKRTVPIPLDRNDQVIVPVVLYDASTERKAERARHGFHQRRVHQAELERASRIALTPTRDLIPRLG